MLTLVDHFGRESPAHEVGVGIRLTRPQLVPALTQPIGRLREGTQNERRVHTIHRG
jgi:hypothetical protein